MVKPLHLQTQTGVHMYTPQQVTSAALTAALTTVERLAADPTMEFVTTEDLIRMSDLEPPNEDDLATVHKQWGFNLMSLREQWRHMVLERAGRWPKTVRGEGFRILAPPQNIEHADTKVLDDVMRVIKKGERIIRGTRNTDLSASEQRQKINSELRFSQMKSTARSAQAQAERERNWRDEPTTRTPPTTPQQTQDQS